MWCKSLTLEKYVCYRMKWFFSPPFLSVSPFLLLNLARWQRYAYAIALFTRPEIKSWPDVKICAHAQCVLPRCSLGPITPHMRIHDMRVGDLTVGKSCHRFVTLGALCYPVACGENWAAKLRSWRAGKKPSAHGSYASHFHEYRLWTRSLIGVRI